MNGKKIIESVGVIKQKLPFMGVFSFSLCSVNSVYYLLSGRAAHPHLLLWGAAGLVEVVTAWLVFQCVETGRRLTRSRISKGDRRFYGVLLALFVALALPSLGLSVWANSEEFGTLRLGWVFPAMSVGCAVGAALPGVAGRYEKRKESERKEAVRKRTERARAKEAAAQEAERRAVLLAGLGARAATFRALAENPGAGPGELATIIGRTTRTVRGHLEALERAGIIDRQNGRNWVKEGAGLRQRLEEKHES